MYGIICGVQASPKGEYQWQVPNCLCAECCGKLCMGSCEYHFHIRHPNSGAAGEHALKLNANWLINGLAIIYLSLDSFCYTLNNSK